MTCAWYSWSSLLNVRKQCCSSGCSILDSRFFIQKSSQWALRNSWSPLRLFILQMNLSSGQTSPYPCALLIWHLGLPHPSRKGSNDGVIWCQFQLLSYPFPLRDANKFPIPVSSHEVIETSKAFGFWCTEIPYFLCINPPKLIPFPV